MSSNIERHLEEVIRDLIAQGVDEFWLCEQGAFDCMARLTLKELKKEFKGISLCLLPAYHPSDAKMAWVEAQDYDLIYPDEVANAPPQVAILRRNDYITKNADYIVCYITHIPVALIKLLKKPKNIKRKSSTWPSIFNPKELTFMCGLVRMKAITRSFNVNTEY